MPGTVLNALCAISHFILPKAITQAFSGPFTVRELRFREVK